MYMFNMKRRRFSLNMYIPVSHTNSKPILYMISVVMTHLVGVGLKADVLDVDQQYVSDYSTVGGQNNIYK